MLKAILLRLLLVIGRRPPNELPVGLFVRRVKVFEAFAGSGYEKICELFKGFKPSVAVAGNVPSVLKFRAEAKTSVLGFSEPS